MIGSLVTGRGQTASRTKTGLVGDLNCLGLYAADEDEGRTSGLKMEWAFNGSHSEKFGLAYHIRVKVIR